VGFTHPGQCLHVHLRNCHAGANPDKDLDLDPQNSYAMLVGIASNQVPGTLRVVPGDPINSYLMHKLERTQPAGQGLQMPIGAPPLQEPGPYRFYFVPVSLRKQHPTLNLLTAVLRDEHGVYFDGVPEVPNSQVLVGSMLVVVMIRDGQQDNGHIQYLLEQVNRQASTHRRC
jgi:hypothetical protein